MTNVRVKQTDDRVNVLGVGVTSASESQVLAKIDQKCRFSLENSHPLFIVTAYSETFLEAGKDPEFKNVVGGADLVVADGVSVLAAMDFVKVKKTNVVRDFQRGLKVGTKILQGEFSGRIVGVKLFKRILEARKYKIFLLGGWNGVAVRLAKRYGCAYDSGVVNLRSMTEAENAKMVAAVNKTQPDVLFVGMGRFKQEKWIAKNLDKLKCKVVVGVGSAFDEVDQGWQVPSWVERMGLKWLWRVFVDPKHIVRAWNAFPVFAWKVFWEYEFKSV